MGRPDGAHTHGHGGGGGAALVVVALVLIAAIGKVAGKAAAEAAHVLAVVLEVALITVASLLGLAVAAALGWAGLRVYRWQSARRAAELPAVIQARAEVITPVREAIEPSREVTSWLSGSSAPGAHPGVPRAAEPACPVKAPVPAAPARASAGR